jgi:predicted transposase YdaD
MQTENHIPQPHDRLFKVAMSIPKVAAAFFRGRLPSYLTEELNLDACQVLDSNFVSKDLQNTRGDLVYKIPLKREEGYVYFCVEHQSNADKLMPIRMMEYRTAVMRRVLEETGEVPIVLGICVYTGEKPYNVAQTLAQMPLNSAMAAKFMAAEQLLIDLRRIEDKELIKDKEATPLELALKQGGQRDWDNWLKKWKKWIINVFNASPYWGSVLRYIFATEEKKTGEELRDFLIELNPAKKDEIMTAATQLMNQGRQEGELFGMQQGRQQGRQEGRQEGIREAILGMSKAGADQEFIRKSTGLSEAEIKKMLGSKV